LPSNVEYDAVSDALRLGGESCAQSDVRHCFFDSKRFIGRAHSAALAADAAQRYPFALMPAAEPDDADGLVRFALFDDADRSAVRRSVAAHEISAVLLGALNGAAARVVARPVRECVIGVPVDFSPMQRRYTEEAAALAGMRVLALVNEPTLAAMAYGLHERTDVHWVLVFDLGGGTLDVSVLEKESSAMFHILSSAGDTHFGGQDFNYAVFGALRARLAPHHAADDALLRLLRAEVERAKRLLNSDQSDDAERLTRERGAPPFTVLLDAALVDAATGERIALTRASFDAMIGETELLRRATAPIARALAQLNLTADNIGEVVMVGGSSRLRCIRRAVHEFFGAKRPLHTSVPPEHAVAIGATLYAARLTHQWPLPMIALESESANDNDNDL
jgi:molecular chaperone DnaK (HSP70)